MIVKSTVSRSRMSTKISFFLPLDVVDSEMGLCTAAEEMVLDR